jgi:hypothetical protein
MKTNPVARPLVITAAVEGMVDEAVARRLVEHIGAEVGPVYGRHGKDHLRRNIGGYNRAARFAPWLVLIDLNSDAECAPALVPVLLSAPSPMMRFRIAVREVESWLLADRERLAGFLGVSHVGVPLQPEAEIDPKRTVVDIARRSKRRAIREDLVPRPGSGRSEGPGYASRMIEFVLDRKRGWRPEVAAGRSDSLRRCLAALETSSLIADVSRSVRE